MNMKLTAAEQFFYDNAGYSYGENETKEEGQLRTAKALAQAEITGRDFGLSFNWELDPDTDSSEFITSRRNAYSLWVCFCYNKDGVIVTSLGGIDFGRDSNPWASVYRRVVEAELARLVLIEG